MKKIAILLLSLTLAAPTSYARSSRKRRSTKVRKKTKKEFKVPLKWFLGGIAGIIVTSAAARLRYFYANPEEKRPWENYGEFKIRITNNKIKEISEPSEGINLLELYRKIQHTKNKDDYAKALQYRKKQRITRKELEIKEFLTPEELEAEQRSRKEIIGITNWNEEHLITRDAVYKKINALNLTPEIKERLKTLVEPHAIANLAGLLLSIYTKDEIKMFAIAPRGDLLNTCTVTINMTNKKGGWEVTSSFFIYILHQGSLFAIIKSTIKFSSTTLKEATWTWVVEKANKKEIKSYRSSSVHIPDNLNPNSVYFN